MAAPDWGNKPINSTGAAPIVAGSTATLYAELDSTQLGTAFFRDGQSRLFQVTYILGGNSTITWQAGTCNSTALSAGDDEFFPSTPAAQSAQYVLFHELSRDQRIRARTTSSVASAAAKISAIPWT